MAAPDISAAFKVTAFAKLPDGKELQASFSVSVTITPGEGAKKGGKVLVPQLKIIEVTERSLVRLQVSTPIIVFDRPIDSFMAHPERYL